MPRLAGLPKRNVAHNLKPVDKNRKQRRGKQQRRDMRNTIDDGRKLAKQWDYLDDDWDYSDED